MRTNTRASARTHICVDDESEDLLIHIKVLRGIKAGVTLTLVIFWIPCAAIGYVFGWMHLIAYGVLLITVFGALGIISRYLSLPRSMHRARQPVRTVR